jgi:hypothetical protein
VPSGFIVNSDPTSPTKRSNTRRPSGSAAGDVVDDVVGDGRTAVVDDVMDGRETATGAVLGVAADPLHAVATNAAATIEIASGRHGSGILSG